MSMSCLFEPFIKTNIMNVIFKENKPRTTMDNIVNC